MLSLLRRFFQETKVNPAAAQLHQLLVVASRQPEFYQQGRVPDTIDGRFELLVLHAFLLFHRLRATDPQLMQDVFDLLFAHFDTNLREMGVGDMGVGKRIKQMAQAFYGRLAAYEQGLMSDTALHEALSRNLFGTQADEPTKAQTAPYVAHIRLSLNQFSALGDDELCAGVAEFPRFTGVEDEVS